MAHNFVKNKNEKKKKFKIENSYSQCKTNE